MAKILLFVFGILVLGVFGQRRPRAELRAPSVAGQVVEIVRQEQDISPDGSFGYSFESADGTSVQESGSLKNPGTENEASEVQGTAQWKAPDGTLINLSWNANENGVVFNGDHLPTPPPTQPIPPAIQRALDWIAKNPSPES